MPGQPLGGLSEARWGRGLLEKQGLPELPVHEVHPQATRFPGEEVLQSPLSPGSCFNLGPPFQGPRPPEGGSGVWGQAGDCSPRQPMGQEKGSEADGSPLCLKTWDGVLRGWRLPSHWLGRGASTEGKGVQCGLRVQPPGLPPSFSLRETPKTQRCADVSSGGGAGRGGQARLASTANNQRKDTRPSSQN